MKNLKLMIAASAALFIMSCHPYPNRDESTGTDSTSALHEASPTTMADDTIKANATTYPADSVSNTSGPDNATPLPENDSANKKK